MHWWNISVAAKRLEFSLIYSYYLTSVNIISIVFVITVLLISIIYVHLLLIYDRMLVSSCREWKVFTNCDSIHLVIEANFGIDAITSLIDVTNQYLGNCVQKHWQVYQVSPLTSLSSFQIIPTFCSNKKSLKRPTLHHTDHISNSNLSVLFVTKSIVHYIHKEDLQQENHMEESQKTEKRWKWNAVQTTREMEESNTSRGAIMTLNYG